MDPLLIGIMSLVGLFVLIALHVPIGPAIGITGLVAFTVRCPLYPRKQTSGRWSLYVR